MGLGPALFFEWYYSQFGELMLGSTKLTTSS